MKFRTEFVEFMPERLEEGVLYVSLRFKAAQHLCPCGCGNWVYLPFHNPETDWTMTLNGGLVTLSPSIGNRFPCKSHYWIKDGEVVWAN